MKTSEIFAALFGAGVLTYAGYQLWRESPVAPRVQVTPATNGTLQTFDGVTGILI